MPTGPSHSHSGGFSSGGFSSGGSSHSGGHSSGGSSFGGGFFGGGYRERGPRTHVWFGRTVVVTNGFVSGILAAVFFFVVGIIVSVMGVGILNSSKTTIATMEADKNEYTKIIKMAELNTTGYGMVTLEDVSFQYYGSGYSEDLDRNVNVYQAKKESGDVIYTLNADTDVLKNGVYYYWIEFTVKDTVQDITITDQTFTQYSQANITSMTQFKIAYQKTSTGIVAINADYDLEKCQEYISAINSKKPSTIMIAAGAVIGLVCLTIIVVLVRNLFKKSKQDSRKAEAEISEVQARVEQEEEKLKQMNRTCEYCGASVPDGAKKCPACGSSVFNKK